MSYVLFSILPFMVCLFWTAVFVLDWRHLSAAKQQLTVFLVVTTMLYFCHALFFSTNSSLKPIAETIYAFCNLAVFPLYYLYILRLTRARDERRQPVQLGLLLFLPSLIVGMWALIDNLFFPECAQSEYYRLLVAKILFFALVLPVCYYGFRRLGEFDKRLADYYSDTESRSVKKTRTLMAVLLACAMCSVTVNHLGREHFSNNAARLAIPSLLFSSLLFGIGFVGMKQNFSIDELEDELAKEDKDEEAEKDEESEAQKLIVETQLINSRLRDKFELLMKEQQLFLQTDLRLSDVARELGISRSALSAFINQTLGVTFSDYVNDLRIAYAKECLRNQKPSKLSSACEQFGFSSEASFYRVFRKHTGMTPLQWMKQASQQ